MGRLTWKKENGEWGIKGVDLTKVTPEVYGALCKLKDYEEICDSPDKLREIDEMYLEKCKEINKKVAAEPIEIKTDCFAYDCKKVGDFACTALDRLYCQNGRCGFYRKKENCTNLLDGVK